MHRLVQKKEIAPSTYAIKVDAPQIAGKARAGQFDRPLTIAETNHKDGFTKIIFQEVGHHEEAAVYM